MAALGAAAVSKETGPDPARVKPNIIALYINDKATGITVEPDSKWPGMFRIRRDCTLSDTVNLSRANPSYSP